MILVVFMLSGVIFSGCFDVEVQKQAKNYDAMSSPDFVVATDVEDAKYWQAKYDSLLRVFEETKGYTVTKKQYDSLYLVHTEMREKFFVKPYKIKAEYHRARDSIYR